MVVAVSWDVAVTWDGAASLFLAAGSGMCAASTEVRGAAATTVATGAALAMLLVLAAVVVDEGEVFMIFVALAIGSFGFTLSSHSSVLILNVPDLFSSVAYASRLEVRAAVAVAAVAATLCAGESSPGNMVVPGLFHHAPLQTCDIGEAKLAVVEVLGVGSVLSVASIFFVVVETSRDDDLTAGSGFLVTSVACIVVVAIFTVVEIGVDASGIVVVAAAAVAAVAAVAAAAMAPGLVVALAAAPHPALFRRLWLAVRSARILRRWASMRISI